MDSPKNICAFCGGQRRLKIRNNRPAGCGDTGYILVQKCEICGREEIFNPSSYPVHQKIKFQGVFC